jgi:hypothetical protein
VKTLIALHKYFDGPTLYFATVLLAAMGHLNYKVFADNSKCMDLAVNGTATKMKPQFIAASRHYLRTACLAFGDSSFCPDGVLLLFKTHGICTFYFSIGIYRFTFVF